MQDYRPALYGGVAAIELRADGIRRVALDVDPRELERRIVLAYTGAPRHSGTNNWDITKRHIDGDRHIFDCFERIRDTAAALRDALARSDWDDVGRQIATEWDNRKRLAPGVSTPAIDELIRRAMAAGATAAKVCGAGGGGCLFCYGPPERDRPWRRRSRRAALGARLPHRDGRPAGWITWRSPGYSGEIADLLEIKAENPFKIRAYRNGADIVANHPHQLAALDAAGLREIPGIGKDLAARILEIAETGDAVYHRELVAEFPPTILDLLHLQGVGPKTVATLYRELGIRTLDDLQQAATDGRIRNLRGMGSKKEALILKALEERRRHAGRHLLSDTHDAAAALVGYLQASARRRPTIEPVGSLRRGCDTCGDLDILASGAEASLMDDFVGYELVERVLVHGDTKSSVLTRGGFQADLRLVPGESHGAALQYFTGSKAHNVALRDRAIDLGFKLNEYGLFRDRRRDVGGRAHEEEVYEALGLPGFRRSFARGSGEIEAAAAGQLPHLVDRTDLAATCTCTRPRPTAGIRSRRWRGGARRRTGVHRHHRPQPVAGDGERARRAARSSSTSARSARSTDRSAAAAAAGHRMRHQARRHARPRRRCLAALDIVVACVHSAFNQDRQQMTDRLLRALENPHVDILGHPTGRRILQREPYPLDMRG